MVAGFLTVKQKTKNYDYTIKMRIATRRWNSK